MAWEPLKLKSHSQQSGSTEVDVYYEGEKNVVANEVYEDKEENWWLTSLWRG